MERLFEVVRSLNVFELPNGESLYKFTDFYESIKKISEKSVDVEDCIITPYYVCGGRRLELYEYELHIRLVDKLDFEQYLLKKTGKTKVNDISKEIIALQKNCYYEILKTEHKLSIEKITKYIDYLYGNDNLKAQIQQVYDRFNIQNLMFEFY